MAILAKFAPAILRRAFFVSGVLAGFASAAVPLTKPPELAQVGLPDAAEIARILVQFRQTGIAGDYYLDFELRTLPRRGDEKQFRGQMWGSRNTKGAITRVSLSEAADRERRLLVQNGGQAKVWRLEGGGVSELDSTAVFEPLIAGVNISAFDLQMPFLYWPGVTLEKITRMRGRPAHLFVFRPPAEFAARNPHLGAVRAYLDTQYNAPTQVESLDRNGRVTKTLTLLDLKKVGEQWIPKSFEVRDETTRDKTRLVVTGAALNLALPGSIFVPTNLAEPALAPPPERIVKIVP